ncbi:MAG: FlgB family protein [Rhodobacteraceae bacterium]|jgi:flagellar basal-body rod protein FlgB|nr:FlgB family protein [Paracoccaceae bacterium]
MFEKLEITAMAQAMAAHAGNRLGVIARNVANADTPGFRRQDIADFDQVWREGGAEGLRSTRPGHIGAAAPAMGGLAAQTVRGHGSPNGNTVSVEAEMRHAVEARQQHEMALAIYRGTSEVIRASLGRRG